MESKIYSENEKNTKTSTQINTEELISLFSSLSYLPSTYINSFLPSTTSLTKAQNIIINHLSTLEITSRSIIDQLQKITDEIIQESPQLNYDVNILYNNIMILSELLNKKKKQIEEFKKETKDYANNNFMNLEIMRQRIQATCSVLKKAKNWKDTETEKRRIELLIENKSLEEAKESINELKCLIEVWKETNEYNKRLNIIKNLDKKILDFNKNT
ncbi:hypothetical protein PCK1_002076 [Pneumocystis canis]|nr:hypothetical protein PCK1_002076 [Pneumocystis canis]